MEIELDDEEFAEFQRRLEDPWEPSAKVQQEAQDFLREFGEVFQEPSSLGSSNG